MCSTGGESHTGSRGRAPHCGATKKVMGGAGASQPRAYRAIRLHGGSAPSRHRSGLAAALATVMAVRSNVLYYPCDWARGTSAWTRPRTSLPKPFSRAPSGCPRSCESVHAQRGRASGGVTRRVRERHPWHSAKARQPPRVCGSCTAPASCWARAGCPTPERRRKRVQPWPTTGLGHFADATLLYTLLLAPMADAEGRPGQAMALLDELFTTLEPSVCRPPRIG